MDPEYQAASRKRRPRRPARRSSLTPGSWTLGGCSSAGWWVWAGLIMDHADPDSYPVLMTALVLTRARKGIPIAPDADGAICAAPTFNGDVPLDPEGKPFKLKRGFQTFVEQRGQLHLSF